MEKIKYIGITFFMVVNILLFYPANTVYAEPDNRNNEIVYSTGDEFNSDNGNIDITISGIREYDVASEIFDIVNSERRENSLYELKMDEELTEAAERFLAFAKENI